MKLLELPSHIQAIIDTYQQKRSEKIEGTCLAVGGLAECWKIPSENAESIFDFITIDTISLHAGSHQLASTMTQIADASGILHILESDHEYHSIQSFCHIQEQRFKQWDFKAVNYTKVSIKNFYLANCRMFYRGVHHRTTYNPNTGESTRIKMSAVSEEVLQDPNYFPSPDFSPQPSLESVLALGQRQADLAARSMGLLLANFEPPHDSLRDSYYFSESEVICDAQNRVVDAEVATASLRETNGSNQATPYRRMHELAPGTYQHNYSAPEKPSFIFKHIFHIRQFQGTKTYFPISMGFATSIDYLQYKEVTIIKKKKSWGQQKIKKTKIKDLFRTSSTEFHYLDVSPVVLNTLISL